MTAERAPRLPAGTQPPAACSCDFCLALAEAISADAEARRAVREAAERVDARHHLQSVRDRPVHPRRKEATPCPHPLPRKP